MEEKIQPEKIEQISADSMIIHWSDGLQCIYNIKILRKNCPCAICREERANENPLKVLNTDLTKIELTGWQWVGNYAISMEWNDKHSTGIYTYQFLRELCDQ